MHSTPPPATAPPGRGARLLELLVLFGAVPAFLAVFVAGRGGRIIIAVLLAVAALCLLLLLRDRAFPRRELVDPHFDRRWLRGLALRFGIGAPALALWVLLFEPDRLFFLPRERPELWLIILVLYPLLSVYPQELVYRTFFFNRYHRLFHDRVPLLIGLNAALFSLAHLFFWNGPALLLTALGGLVFAYNYARTRSLLFVCLEHALWGNFIFTIGLGHYFYGGTVNNPLGP